MSLIQQVLEADKGTKPTGLDSDSANLLALYEGRGRDLVRNYLRRLGMGDRDGEPLQSGVVSRLIHARSVLYAAPATRVLKRGRDVLAPDDPDSIALAEIEERCAWQIVLSEIDRLRLLLESVIVEWSEAFEQGAIVPRVFAPHQVFRKVDPSAADQIQRDEAFALCLVWGSDERTKRFRLYERLDEDGERWRVSVVDGRGDRPGRQPYLDTNGVIPFDRLPVQLFSARPHLGRAWLPVSQPTLAISLAVDAILSELAILVRHQGHGQAYGVAGQSTDTETMAAALEQGGPDVMPVLPPESELRVLDRQPKISESQEVVARYLSSLALTHGLPPDAFAMTSAAISSEALRIKERDLDRWRKGLVPLAAQQEGEMCQIHRSILDEFSEDLDLPTLPRDVRMATYFSPAWQPASIREAQDTAFRDVAVGAMSLLEYVAQTRSVSLSEAASILDRIEADRARFPASSVPELVSEATENPGALTSGPKPALGPGSATPIERAAKRTGAQLVAGSVEGASATAAAKRRLVR